MSRKTTMIAAIREAIDEEMLRDENVIVLGEDIGPLGGPFGSCIGLLEKYGPDRILSTPISEWGFTGIGVGTAMRGKRPIVELMYNDFISVCLDPVMNQAAKLHYMTGGQGQDSHGSPRPDGHRPPRRGAALAEHGVPLRPYSGSEARLPLHAGGRQGSAQDRHPRRRPGRISGAQAALSAEGGDA